MSSLCPTFNFKPFDLIDYVWTKQQDTIKSLICVQQRTESHTVFGLHEFILLGEQTRLGHLHAKHYFMAPELIENGCFYGACPLCIFLNLQTKESHGLSK